MTFTVCKTPGCYIWTPHTHIDGVTLLGAPFKDPE